MERDRQVSQESFSLFELQARVGLTKHIGGLAATKELIALCHINQDSYVLDVGCGVGITPCYIAKAHGCQVVGVDIHEGMVERSRERAEREGVTDRTEFRVADAQSLPFEDDLFDVVICESVLAFVEDKRKGLGEFVRVTKPGGYVGINESIWIKTPSPEMAELFGRPGYGGGRLPTEGWDRLLADAGLGDISGKSYQVDARSESVNQLQRYGCRGLLRIWARILVLYLTSPTYRRFAKEAVGVPKELMEYMGYAIYVGRKPR